MQAQHAGYTDTLIVTVSAPLPQNGRGEMAEILTAGIRAEMSRCPMSGVNWEISSGIARRG
jgi:hypothetical protein